LKTIQSYQHDGVFNPYTDRCERYDRFNAHVIRRQNLRKALAAALSHELDSIWIGRDLGHRGGRRTGLALTDEVHLQDANKKWKIDLMQATKGEPFSERTAKNIWQVLNKLDNTIFMWNVFPFHPHEDNKPLSNRSHTALERDAGMVILEELLQLLKPKNIVAIGNNAYNVSLRLVSNQSVFKVRHPSYGGEKDFFKQLNSLYKICE